MLYGFTQEDWVFVQTPNPLDDVDNILIEEKEDGSCFARCSYFNDGAEVMTSPVRISLPFGELKYPCTLDLQEKANLLPFLSENSHPTWPRSGRIVRILTAPDGTRGRMSHFYHEFFVNGRDHGLYEINL